MTSLSEADIASRIDKHRADIVRQLPVNFAELAHAGIQSGLFDSRDLDFYLNQNNPRREKTERLLTSLKQKANGYSKFLRCIQESRHHMGHTYIASLLEDQDFADEPEIKESATFRERINKNASRLKDVNLSVLCPILFNKKLITTDELESLTNTRDCQYETRRNLLLFQILDTKGPTAHSIFVRCLGKEDTHPYHKELFQLLSGPEESSLPARKRTRRVSAGVVSPEKRFPHRLEMHGELATAEYGRTVRSWRSWVSNGQWNETERAEQMYMRKQSKNLAMKTAVLLQSVIARIFRKEYPKARQLLEICEQLCYKVEGDNVTFLRGRCKYTWSWLYRYLKQPKKKRSMLGTQWKFSSM